MNGWWVVCTIAFSSSVAIGCGGEAETYEAPRIRASTYVDGDQGFELTDSVCLFFGGQPGWGSGGSIESETGDHKPDLLAMRSRTIDESLEVVMFKGPFEVREPDAPGATVVVSNRYDASFIPNREHDEVAFRHRDRDWLLVLDGEGTGSWCSLPEISFEPKEE